MRVTSSSLAHWLSGSPYQGYTYSYPHKTAYRPLDPPVPLGDLWAHEAREALFLYLHVPFCEMRCGFCNLFTTANPDDSLVHVYLCTLQRQAQRVREALGPMRVVRMAMGGGTPTFLTPSELHQLFDMAEQLYGVTRHTTPMAVETSPATALPERLSVLRERGVDRVSMGVQSMIEAEVRAIGRTQGTATVRRALESLVLAGFPTINIDLIYGLPGQTLQSWRTSLQAVLEYAPAEVYLYPLYVRPLTGLGRQGRVWDDTRLALYRCGREMLLEAGYVQSSMRMFRQERTSSAMAPVYCCQDDGMIGLGCGARSYTRGLHYASTYAVSATGVREILADYLRSSEAAFAFATHGFYLTLEEQQRRFLIQSLLQADGLDFQAYTARFGTSPWEDWPALYELLEHELAIRGATCLRLTPAGLERSDTIGPWLYSRTVRARMEDYRLR